MAEDMTHKERENRSLQQTRVLAWLFGPPGLHLSDYNVSVGADGRPVIVAPVPPHTPDTLETADRHEGDAPNAPPAE